MSVADTNSLGGTPCKRALWECSENYLCLANKRYVVTLTKRGDLFCEEKVSSCPWWQTALKVISYVLFILPLIALVVRALFRNSSYGQTMFPDRGGAAPPDSADASGAGAVSCDLTEIDVGKWFADLRRKTAELKLDVHPFAKEGESKTPPVVHRFHDICCPKETAVQPVLVEGQAHILHANHVNMNGSRYIATQAPTLKTQELFWRTCLKNGSRLIVDLTNEDDQKGDPSVISYCPQFYRMDSPAGGYEESFGGIQISCIEEKKDTHITTSKYKVTEEGKTVEVTRIHYSGWQDFGAAGAQELHTLMERVDSVARGLTGPITVHCRAGVGRTGSFITARTLYQLKSQGRLTEAAFQQVTTDTVMAGRRARGPHFVQSKKQLQGLVAYGEHLLKDEAEG